MNKSVYLIDKPTFEDIESLMRNSKTLISCHGAITHAANSLNVKIIDIIEEDKKKFYQRFTSYMNDYYPIYRSSFDLIKEDIYKKLSLLG
jgi:5-formaminoimidazole-4-carboxamide-1-beta-D-ribofuranosyl 5'-monophosphate synthetase